MSFVPFALVEWQSRHEEHTEISLADSGSTPAALRDFVDEGVLAALLDTTQRYPEVPGTARLRALIASRHGARRDNVLTTVGGTEANAVALEAMISPGDHVVVIEPGYGQIPGYAANLGAVVDTVPLDPARGWRPDLDALDRVVGPRTKLIAVTNPNNPTGMVLRPGEIDRIVAAAAKHGTWLLADEVHRGTELHTDDTTPSLWGRYDRLLCVGSLSKAFGLPGLRLGWLLGPPEFIALASQRHEYVTVSAALPSMLLAEVALDTAADALIARNRANIRAGADRLLTWVAAHADLVSIVPPEATALGFLRYHVDLPSEVVADRLRTGGGVLVIPSAHFGVEDHIRITHGIEPAVVDTALDRIAKVLGDLSDAH